MVNECIFPSITEEEQRLPFYITSAGGWDNQEPMRREEGYPDFQWIQTLNGTGLLRVPGKELAVSQGQGMFLVPNESHEYVPLDKPWEVRWVAFNGEQAYPLLAAMDMKESKVMRITNPDRLLQHMHAVVRLLRSSDPMRGFQCSALMYQIIVDLFIHASPAEVRSKRQHYEQLAPALRFVEERYGEPLTLAMLADCMQLSPQYVCLLFQKTMGLRPFEYVAQVRMSKAKEMLLNDPDMDVKEVARQVGYDHSSYFIKLFKEMEGITPTAFRKIHKIR